MTTKVISETSQSYPQRANLEVACQAKLLARPDEPLSRVILVPFDSIAVVHRELVVEVVVPFANGNESSDEMVARSMFIIEWGFTKPVGEGVDTECRLESRGQHIMGVKGRNVHGEQSKDAEDQHICSHPASRPNQGQLLRWA